MCIIEQIRRLSSGTNFYQLLLFRMQMLQAFKSDSAFKGQIAMALIEVQQKSKWWGNGFFQEMETYSKEVTAAGKMSDTELFA